MNTRFAGFRLSQEDLDGLLEIAKAHDIRDGIRQDLSRTGALRWLIAQELDRLADVKAGS